MFNLIFTHIPKTAGSTFVEILKKNYIRHMDCFLGNITQTGMINRLAATPKFLLDKVECLAGELPFGVHRFFDQPCQYVTFLRDPVERVISDYYYCLLHPTKYHRLLGERFIRDNDGALWTIESNGVDMSALSFREYLENDTLTRSNLMTRYIAGLSDDKTGTDSQVKTSDLDVAKENIKSYHIGFTKTFDESILAFKQKFGWNDISHPLRLVYNDKKLPSKYIDPDIIKLIKEKNQLDIELYEFARSL